MSARIKRAVFLLLILAPLRAQRAIPKKYDPAVLQTTLQTMQGSITGNSRKIDAALLAFHSIGQITQKVNGLAIDLKTLQVQVNSLDVTENRTAITRLEERNRHEDDDRAKSEATSKAEYSGVMWLLRCIVGGVVAVVINLFVGHFLKKKRDKKVDKALVSIEKQTNGTNTKLQDENTRVRDENTRLHSEVARLSALRPA